MATQLDYNLLFSVFNFFFFRNSQANKDCDKFIVEKITKLV